MAKPLGDTWKQDKTKNSLSESKQACHIIDRMAYILELALRLIKYSKASLR
jgi:hypothetical protein